MDKEPTMKRKLLMTGAVIALFAGMSAASAQMGGTGDQRPGMNSPSSGGNRGEEQMKSGVHEKEPGAAVQNDKGEKKGITAQNEPRGGTAQEKMSQGESKEKLGKGESKEKMGEKSEGKEKLGKGESKERMGEKSESKEKLGKGESKERMGEKSESKERIGEKSESKEKIGQTGESTTRSSQGTSSAKSVQLSSEQRARISTSIKTTIKSQHVEPVRNVNFDVRVGVRVPRTVHLYTLPIEIVEIVPEYRGFEYVLVGDEILIIDPNTLEIVAVLPA
jgi:hypothetical protein